MLHLLISCFSCFCYSLRVAYLLVTCKTCLLTRFRPTCCLLRLPEISSESPFVQALGCEKCLLNVEKRILPRKDAHFRKEKSLPLTATDFPQR